MIALYIPIEPNIIHFFILGWQWCTRQINKELKRVAIALLHLPEKCVMGNVRAMALLHRT